MSKKKSGILGRRYVTEMIEGYTLPAQLSDLGPFVQALLDKHGPHTAVSWVARDGTFEGMELIRLETEQEAEARYAQVTRLAEQIAANKKKEKASKEDQDYKTYLRLQKKFKNKK